MDGKHVAFAPPRAAGSTYFNYKKFHSLVLLAVVDARYRFTLVDIGCNGRVSDGGVYANSAISTALRENLLNIPQEKTLPGSNIKVPHVIVADDAFHLETYLLKPIRDCETLFDQIFNYRTSRVRRVVENVFGILANRFRILLTTIRLSPEKVELIILTLCILHNFLIDEADSTYLTTADVEDTNQCTIGNGSWRDNKPLPSLPQQGGNRTGLHAREVREMFSRYFNSIGYVPWQWEAVKKYNF